MSEQALYSVLAKYYDRVYHWKDYDGDIQRLLAYLADRGRRTGGALLDVGCGTGEHLVRLAGMFECTGIDSNEAMLEVARGKLRDVRFLEADMTDFRLGRRFDVIISLFGTIGYARTLGDVRRTLGCIADHLEEGGVVVIEPFLSRGDVKEGHVAMTTYEDEEVKISRVSTGHAEGELFTLEMHYLIGEKGKGVQYVQDRHTMRLHEPDELVHAMEEVGIPASYDPVGFGQERGAIIGVKAHRA